MTTIKTVFALRGKKTDINIDADTVPGFGQDAANEIVKRYPYPGIKKILKGHIINDKFVKADLTSTWDKTNSSSKRH